MRGFFAFGVGELFSAELDVLLKTLPPEPKLKSLHWEDFHVTIKFLSEFSSTKFFACLPELCALGKPPEDSLKAGRLALWPTVLVLECEPSEALVRWHRSVNQLLERKGFLHERHPRFHPHITLARRKPEHKLETVEAWLREPAHCGQFEGRAIHLTAPMLWRSQAEETGRRHQPLLSPLF